MTNIIQLNNIPDFSIIDLEKIKPMVLEILKSFRQESKQMIEEKKLDWDHYFKTKQMNDIYFTRLMSAINHLLSTNYSKELEDIIQEVNEEITKYSYEILQNKDMYELYKNLENLDLNETQKLILKRKMKGFKESGLDLNEEEKIKLQEITIELDKLTTQYDSNNIQCEEEFSLVVSEEELIGVPENTKNIFKKFAEDNNMDGYLIKLIYPYYMDIIKFCSNRELRKLIYTKSYQIASEHLLEGNYDNYPLMEKIVKLRNEESKLLGYKNYSEHSLSDKMAKNEENVLKLLNQIKDRSKSLALNDFNIIKDFALEKDGVSLEEHDFHYYVNIYQRERLNFDSEKLRDYFPIDTVINGLFWLIEELFSTKITFKEKLNEHKDIYEVIKPNGQSSFIIMDLFAREGKSSGAWVGEYTSYIKNDIIQQDAVAFLVCNFSKNKDGSSYLRMGEVETLFHEMGHALHLTLSEVQEEFVVGFNGVPFDGVELPSQLMEYFCYDKKVLQKISKHKDTGLPISEEIIKQMKNNSRFLSAYGLLRQVEFSLVDLLIYNSVNQNHYDIYHELKKETSFFSIDESLRFLNGFSHIYSGGYAVGYYGYKWADVLSADAFEEFKNNGVISKEVGDKFVKTILSQGGSKEFGELFKDFKGREPDSAALFKYLFD